MGTDLSEEDKESLIKEFEAVKREYEWQKFLYKNKLDLSHPVVRVLYGK